MYYTSPHHTRADGNLADYGIVSHAPIITFTILDQRPLAYFLGRRASLASAALLNAFFLDLSRRQQKQIVIAEQPAARPSTTPTMALDTVTLNELEDEDEEDLVVVAVVEDEVVEDVLEDDVLAVVADDDVVAAVAELEVVDVAVVEVDVAVVEVDVAVVDVDVLVDDVEVDVEDEDVVVVVSSRIARR